jgi:predicted nucleic acid-binding Zn ribbon protein
MSASWRIGQRAHLMGCRPRFLPRFAVMCFNFGTVPAIPGTEMESSKRCPCCAEQIPDAAITCRRCGSALAPEPARPQQQGELIRWQYKILIAILITGAILLYSAPKSVPVTPKRVATPAAHSGAHSAPIQLPGPAQIAGPVRTPAEVQAAPVAQALPPSPSSPPAADVGIASVQAISPAAAQRIRSHCAKATAEGGNTDESLKSCEHGEIDAWDRVVLDREFPPHDSSLDRRCSERPFPADSFVAYEACLRAVLKGR